MVWTPVISNTGAWLSGDGWFVAGWFGEVWPAVNTGTGSWISVSTGTGTWVEV